MTALALPAFVPDATLDPAVRRLAIGLVGARLADAVDLGTQARQARWNVKGPNADALQILFDGIHEALDGYVDLLGERVIQLGGVAFGTARQSATRSILTEYPPVVEGQDHLVAMTAVLAEFGVLVREAVHQTTGWGDRESAELCTEISRGIDRWLWMVEAHEGSHAALHPRASDLRAIPRGVFPA